MEKEEHEKKNNLHLKKNSDALKSVQPKLLARWAKKRKTSVKATGKTKNQYSGTQQTSASLAPKKATRKALKKSANLQILLQQNSRKVGRKTLPTSSSSDLQQQIYLITKMIEFVKNVRSATKIIVKLGSNFGWAENKWFHYQCVGLSDRTCDVVQMLCFKVNYKMY